MWARKHLYYPTLSVYIWARNIHSCLPRVTFVTDVQPSTSTLEMCELRNLLIMNKIDNGRAYEQWNFLREGLVSILIWPPEEQNRRRLNAVLPSNCAEREFCSEEQNSRICVGWMAMAFQLRSEIPNSFLNATTAIIWPLVRCNQIEAQSMRFDFTVKCRTNDFTPNLFLVCGASSAYEAPARATRVARFVASK